MVRFEMFLNSIYFFDYRNELIPKMANAWFLFVRGSQLSSSYIARKNSESIFYLPIVTSQIDILVECKIIIYFLCSSCFCCYYYYIVCIIVGMLFAYIFPKLILFGEQLVCRYLVYITFICFECRLYLS